MFLLWILLWIYFIFLFIQLLEELHEKQNQEAKLREEVQSLRDTLRLEKHNSEEVLLTCDRLRALCEDKEKALQVSL